MTLKAIIPPGQTEIVVNGLHQWDYGRILEIHSDELPALIEVHFACVGMKEAVVRSCTAISGVAKVAIPDACLEQSAPITAWIYQIDSSEGATIKTVTMTVIERPRPQVNESVPTIISDKYTELVDAINEQVEALKGGEVTVSRALTAESANTATSANTAEYATHAYTAGAAEKAKLADTATTATRASTADQAVTAYSANEASVLNPSYCVGPDITKAGIYLVSWRTTSSGKQETCSEVLHIRNLNEKAYAQNKVYFDPANKRIEIANESGYVGGSLMSVLIADYTEAVG